MANRTRSPLLEAYTKIYAAEARFPAVVTSAGVKRVAVRQNGHHDFLVDPHTDLDLSSHVPRFVGAEDTEFDIVLSVGPRVKYLFDEMFPQHVGKSYTVKGFLGMSGEIIDAYDRRRDADVSSSYDPWYDRAAGIMKGTPEAYRRLVEETKILSEQIVGKILRERAASGI